ncbi:Major facilitator superfamily transporter [Colletotrichum higginsianum IMI 349063]|uniref:Major facilitator superfamily transporter n=2 Tax=Colletotrichum higginsianum TaxID=80884 RepID=A0A1B7Y4Y8_COLHI|nr:Major facilitator superfamily transporter [Colletotrichum higginsianum IMI 349063]OBR07080.1 Major facilitator superfamily transporter [Colletotrichum higginsianum IMI 349063]TIC92297.1 putative MFS-type transporter [Colletotrichum higginsianum]
MSNYLQVPDPARLQSSPLKGQKQTRFAPLPPRPPLPPLPPPPPLGRHSCVNPRSSWMRKSQRFQPPPPSGRLSRLPRLSRLSYYPVANEYIEGVFNEKTALPPRWSFYVPDFDFDVEEFDKYEKAVSGENGGEGDDDEDYGGVPTALKAFRVDFWDGDPADPKSWSTAYRVFVVGMFAFTTLATGIYSTAYSSGIPQMSEELHITNPSLPLLGISLYLVGLALGALIMAPLSETFGRRPMYIGGLTIFLGLIPVAALATDFTTVIVARFLGAVAGSVMLSNVGGSIMDITNPKYLPLAMSVYSFGPLNGPVLGPLMGGFLVEAFGWRSLNWMSLISTAVGALFIMTVPETYRPTLLRKKAAQKRREEEDHRYWSDFDDTVPILRRIRTAVSRPFILSFTEPVLMFWNVYISVIYAIVQLAYVAFPIVYQNERGWTTAISGLAFVGVFVGIALVLATEPLLRRLVNRQPKNPETGQAEPEATVLLICIGAVLEPVGQLAFALTSLPVEVPFYWSVLSGVPFGYGFGLVFIYGTSYISKVFGMYATSASAGNLVFRSILGAVLVLVGKSMYAALTPRVAGIAVGVAEVALMPVPFVFFKWGKKIRQRSKLIRTLEEQAKKMA